MRDMSLTYIFHRNRSSQFKNLLRRLNTAVISPNVATMDEHGDRARQSDGTRLVRWQRGPKAPNPHDVLHPRPRAHPRGPHRQRGGREACVGHEDGFEVLPMPHEER